MAGEQSKTFLDDVLEAQRLIRARDEASIMSTAVVGGRPWPADPGASIPPPTPEEAAAEAAAANAPTSVDTRAQEEVLAGAERFDPRAVGVSPPLQAPGGVPDTSAPIMGDAAKALQSILRQRTPGVSAETRQFAGQAQADAASARTSALTQAENISQKAEAQYGAMLGEQGFLTVKTKALEEARAEWGERRQTLEARMRYPHAKTSMDNIRDVEDIANGKVVSTPEARKAAQDQLEEWSDTDPFAGGPFGKIGGRIIAALAVALGAYGSALTGQPHPALQIINRQLDEHIAKLKEERGDAKEAFEREFDMNLKNEADLVQLKVMGLQATSNVIGMLAQSANSQEAAAKYSAMQAEIASGIDKLDQDAVKSGMDAKMRAALGLAQMGEATRQAAAASAPSQSPIPGTTVVDPSLPVDKESVKTAREYIGNYKQAQALLEKIRTLRGGPDGTGAEIINRKNVGIAKQLAARLIVKLKQMDAMGANFTKNEQELLEQQVPADPTEIGFTLARLESMVNQLTDESDIFLMQHNLKMNTPQDEARRALAAPLPALKK